MIETTIVWGIAPGKTAVAVRCPCHVKQGRSLRECGETFPLKRRGDPTTYNVAQYHAHLRFVHKIELPRPLIVLES
jgi:hypothetical protein